MLCLRMICGTRDKRNRWGVGDRGFVAAKPLTFQPLLWIAVIGVLGVLAFPAGVSAGSAHVGQNLKGWGTRQAHVQYYQKMIAQYNQSPERFSQRYRLMTRSIRTPKFFEHMSVRLLSNPARFVTYHHCFSKFLDGQMRTFQSPLTNGTPSNSGSNLQAAQQLNGGGGNNGGGTSPGSPLVPEPSSILLVGSAVLVGGFVRWRQIRRQSVALLATIA